MMHRQRGFTLVGMMVGASLGMIVTLAALATFQLVRAGYASVVDGVLIEERGQRALAIMSHAIRQAGWIPVQVAQAAAHAAPAAPLEGRDDCANPSIGAEMRCTRAGVLGSDALLVRVSGSGLANDPTLPDGTMSDCGGYALPARASRSDSRPHDHHAASNLFYIGIASDGVPQLLCRYPRRDGNRARTNAYTAGTLVRGVEAMQLRYGVDTDNDGRIDRFVPARSLQEEAHAGWHRVLAVQIAVVIRGERPTVAPSLPQTLTLLPAQADDKQTDALTFVASLRPELRRRVFATTIRLRNPSPCREAIC